MSVYLIRHGETAWSRSGQYTGRTELDLTSHGEDDARGLARRLHTVAFGRVFTSPRLRAQRTCALAGLAAPPEIDPDLAEWDYGDFEGLRSAEILARRPGWNLFRDGCPGGESPAAVSARADRVVARLLALSGDVAVFSHGHFGRVLGVRWIGLDLAFAQAFLLGTAGISVLAVDRGQPVIGGWNALAPSPDAHDAHHDAERHVPAARWDDDGGHQAGGGAGRAGSSSKPLK